MSDLTIDLTDNDTASLELPNGHMATIKVVVSYGPWVSGLTIEQWRLVCCCGFQLSALNWMYRQEILQNYPAPDLEKLTSRLQTRPECHF